MPCHTIFWFSDYTLGTVDNLAGRKIRYSRKRSTGKVHRHASLVIAVTSITSKLKG